MKIHRKCKKVESGTLDKFLKNQSFVFHKILNNFEIKFQVLFEMSNALGVRFQSNFSASSASASSQRPISAVMMPKIPT